MTIDDVAVLAGWDHDPDVAAAIGGRGADWYDWPAELVRDVPWRELLIAEEDGSGPLQQFLADMAKRHVLIGLLLLYLARVLPLKVQLRKARSKLAGQDIQDPNTCND